MFHRILQSLKAVANLVGVALTAVTAVIEAPLWVTVAAAVATAVAQWSIPNLEIDPRTGSYTNVRKLVEP